MITARRSSTSASRPGSASRSATYPASWPATSDTTATASATSWASSTRVGSSEPASARWAMESAAVASCGQVVAAEVPGDVADERDPRLVGRRTQRVGVAEPLGLGVQGVVLTGLGSDCLDLLESVPEDVGGLGQLARLTAAALEVGGELPPVRVGRAVAVEQLEVGGPRVPVEGATLLGRAGQPQLVGLAVDGEQPLGELTHDADRNAPATEEGPGAALGADGAGQDEAAVVVRLGAGVGRPLPRRRGGRQEEPALHARATGGANPAGIGPSTEEQGQAGHHHGLAGAGLARDDGEAAAELQGDVVDRPQPADPQLGQPAVASGVLDRGGLRALSRRRQLTPPYLPRDAAPGRRR